MARGTGACGRTKQAATRGGHAHADANRIERGFELETQYGDVYVEVAGIGSAWAEFSGLTANGHSYPHAYGDVRCTAEGEWVCTNFTFERADTHRVHGPLADRVGAHVAQLVGAELTKPEWRPAQLAAEVVGTEEFYRAYALRVTDGRARLAEIDSQREELLRKLAEREQDEEEHRLRLEAAQAELDAYAGAPNAAED